MPPARGLQPLFGRPRAAMGRGGTGPPGAAALTRGEIAPARTHAPTLPATGCPLCMEDMDVTDRNFRPCKCGYQICLFCYNKIKDDAVGGGEKGVCPACRTPYDEANATFVTPDPQEMARMAKEKKAREQREKREQQAREAKELKDRMAKERQEATAAAAATAAARTNSAGATVGSAGSGGAAAGASIPGSGSSGSLNTMVRQAAAGKQPAAPARAPVNQRTLVYVMGLSPRIAREEILRRHEYFGQYGKVLKIVITHTPQSARANTAERQRTPRRNALAQAHAQPCARPTMWPRTRPSSLAPPSTPSRRPHARAARTRPSTRAPLRHVPPFDTCPRPLVPLSAAHAALDACRDQDAQ